MNIAWKEIKKNKVRFLILGSIVFLVSLLTFIISGLANGLSQDNAALIKDLPSGQFYINDDANETYNLSRIDSSIQDKMLNNDVDTNGLYYSKSIDITLTNTSDTIEVQFKDSGIGLAVEQIDRIYDRFYRADPSRSKAVDGTGLGLSIVQTIVQLHQGKIVVESGKDIGTTFTVNLPYKGPDTSSL